MILSGQLLIADDARCLCQLSPGYVRVQEDRIVEVVEGEIPATADFGDANTLISPGFIDAHLHLPQFDMMGAHAMPLLRWLSDVTFPAEMKWADADYARAMTRRVVAQLFSVGTTAIGAFATVHHDSAAAAIEVARDAGMRGVIGQVLMNREAPEELCRGVAQLLDEAAELGESFPPENRMAAAVTPRFAVSCDENLLAGAGRLAEQTGAIVQSHLAETINECAYVKQLFDGRSYVDVYRCAGLLGGRSVLGHGIHLDEEDRRVLRDSGTVIAHCPTANTFLRSGTMERAAMVRAGVAVALGSDIGAGYERSMVRVARAMIEAAASIGDEFPSADAAWYAITAGNAEALGWHDAGRLRVDAPADLLVIQPAVPWTASQVDPLATLMFTWDDRWISRTFVRGELKGTYPSLGD